MIEANDWVPLAFASLKNDSIPGVAASKSRISRLAQPARCSNFAVWEPRCHFGMTCGQLHDLIHVLLRLLLHITCRQGPAGTLVCMRFATLVILYHKFFLKLHAFHLLKEVHAICRAHIHWNNVLLGASACGLQISHRAGQRAVKMPR